MEHAETRRIGRVAALRVVARLGEHTGVQPVPAHRGPVVHELAESIDLLSRRLHDLGLVLGIGQIGQCLPVHLLQDLGQIGAVRVGVAPGDVQDLLGQGAAFLRVEIADGEVDPGEDLLVRLRLAGGIDRLPLPLQPAGRVGERPVLLGEIGGGEEEDLGLDLRRLGAAVFSRCSPEDGGLRLHVLDNDHPLQLGERRHHLLRVGPEPHRVHAEGDEPFGAGLLASHTRGAAPVHIVEDVKP